MINRIHIFLIIFNIIIICLTLLVVPTLILPITLFALKWILFGNTQPSGEGSFLLLALGAWGFLLTLPVAFIISYLICMKLTVYLREKRGWGNLHHPRRLFLTSFLILTIVILLFSLPLITLLPRT